MRRLLPILLLCAGGSLGAPALAADNCTANSTDPSDPAVSFPDGSYDSIFTVNSDGNGGYRACFYSPTVLNMSAFSQDSIADFNKDGWIDLVLGVRSSGGGEVEIFLNDGTGSGIVVSNTLLPTGGSTAPNVVGTPDLNGDGWPDILTSNGANGTVSVMLNDGTGAFPAVKQYAAGSNITALAAVDLDGDGHPDIVTNDTAHPSVDVLMNTGTGDLKPAVVVPVGSTPTYMQVVDVNGDGHPDVVTGSGQNVSVLINNGDGTFAPAVDYYTPLLMYVSVQDVNNDGKPDIVVYASYQASVAVYAMLNNGDGTFAAPAWVVLGGINSGSSGANIGVSTGGSTLIGGNILQLSGGNAYASASGNVTPPTITVAVNQPPSSSAGGSTATTSGSGSKSSSSSSGSKSHTASIPTGGSGGGAMEWLSLLFLGFATLLRRRRA